MCGGSRAYLPPARESRLPGRHGRKPPQNSPASRPRWTSKASMASRKLVRAPRQPRLPPPLYCAAAAARPSDATAGPDRDQRDLLCPPTRAGGAALRGRTIIWHRWTPDRRRVALLLFWLLRRPGNPSLSQSKINRSIGSPLFHCSRAGCLSVSQLILSRPRTRSRRPARGSLARADTRTTTQHSGDSGCRALSAGGAAAVLHENRARWEAAG
eukprot:COSAG03_NODE_241_length_10086_cov_8.397817_5_plen_213_part_00